MSLVRIFLIAFISTFAESHRFVTHARRLVKSIKNNIKCTFSSTFGYDQSQQYRDLKLEFFMNQSTLFNASNEESTNVTYLESIETLSNVIKNRNYYFEITQGIWEGMAAEIVTSFLSEERYSYSTADTVHLTLKSVMLDMLTNAATLLLPKLQSQLLNVIKFIILPIKIYRFLTI